MESSKLKTEQQLEESKDNADVTDATKIDVEDNFDIDDIWEERSAGGENAPV